MMPSGFNLNLILVKALAGLTRHVNTKGRRSDRIFEGARWAPKVTGRTCDCDHGYDFRSSFGRREKERERERERETEREKEREREREREKERERETEREREKERVRERERERE